MFVCICNQVTDKQIRQSVSHGVSNLNDLAATLGVGTCCGKCKNCAKQVLRDAVQESGYMASPVAVCGGSMNTALATT